MKTKELNDNTLTASIVLHIKKTISVKQMTLPKALRLNGYKIDLKDKLYTKIKSAVESDVEILTHGKKRGTLYFTKQTPKFLTTEQKANKAYKILKSSPVELAWKQIIKSTELDGTDSAAIQAILKQLHPDVIQGSKRYLWAIDGTHELGGGSGNTYLKDKTKWCYCPHCGEELK